MKDLFYLDDIGLFCLRVYRDSNNKVRLYSIDIEKADDCHYDFEPAEFKRLEKVLKKKYKKRNVIENLKQLVSEGKNELDSELRLIDTLRSNNIKFKLFSYGEW